MFLSFSRDWGLGMRMDVDVDMVEMEMERWPVVVVE